MKVLVFDDDIIPAHSIDNLRVRVNIQGSANLFLMTTSGKEFFILNMTPDQAICYKRNFLTWLTTPDENLFEIRR